MFSSKLPSNTVPGVTTLITSLLTMPFTLWGSSICSPMATLYPASTNFDIYEAALWKGIPHIGALSSNPQDLPVKAISSTFEATIASSKNIS